MGQDEAWYKNSHIDLKQSKSSCPRITDHEWARDAIIIIIPAMLESLMSGLQKSQHGQHQQEAHGRIRDFALCCKMTASCACKTRCNKHAPLLAGQPAVQRCERDFDSSAAPTDDSKCRIDVTNELFGCVRTHALT
ncbi:hypothetical protein CBOM_07764 [Ceraceosorus bombacis]|uniref:Uncharacterized protein n=1 Tax=Ceraceosorus bombacis TaxID=401625 RepID=A0A0P1BPD9_9BASI|nr:hypothetical protein CBOM_07764 [Ceraceosorus bombacis]